VGDLKARLRARAVNFVRIHAQPPEEVREPGNLLSFPSNHSYVPPTLLMFGQEPGVTTKPWVTVGKYSSINGGTRVLVGGVR
jgi:hypothetical protein